MTTDRETPQLSEVWDLLQKQEERSAQQEARADEQQRRLAELEAENAYLKAGAQRVDTELEHQRLEKVALTSRMKQVEDRSAPPDKKLSRARLFKAAAMGSAAVVGAGALGTLGAENAAAETIDTDFIATGGGTNFDARGTSPYAFYTFYGSFTIGAYLRGSSYGVYGVGNGAGSSGLSATGEKYGAQLYSSTVTGVPLLLSPGSSAGSPASGPHSAGEVYVDSTGRIFHCVTTGTPGTWVPLNALIPISPVRVLDTRTGTSLGPYPTGTALNVAIASQTFATSSGSFTFPSNTIGVVGNLVAVTPTGAGYLVAYPQGVPIPTAASVNFVPPGTGADIYYAIGNNVTVALGPAGWVSLYMGLVSGATVHIVLDIAGYFV